MYLRSWSEVWLRYTISFLFKNILATNRYISPPRPEYRDHPTIVRSVLVYNNRVVSDMPHGLKWSKNK